MFPNLDDLLLNPVVASAAVVAIVSVISQAAGGVKPTWLSLAVALIYMIGGYLVAGRTAPDQLFLAAIYGLLLVAPLAHVDGSVLNRLFGGSSGVRAVDKPNLFQPTL